MDRNQSQDWLLSMTLASEHFSNASPEFLPTLCRTASPKAFTTFAKKWYQDPRPWARKQLCAYLQLPLNHMDHQPLVKQLFKLAEADNNDEIMGLFLLAFDQNVRRVRARRYHYDYSTYRSHSYEVLKMPSNTLELNLYKHRWRMNYLYSTEQRLFSNQTRLYLRRRAWRYFRHMGFQRPDDYLSAISKVVKLYRDEDFQKGEHILDNWGLINACYRYSEDLTFTASKIKLEAEKKIAELKPAPRFPEVWRKQEAFEQLMDIFAHAKSRFVRHWALQMLEIEHQEALGHLTVDQLIIWMQSPHADVQAFALDVLAKHPDIHAIKVDDWLKFLSVQDENIFAGLCQLIKEHVRPDRFSLEQVIELSCMKRSAVVELGLELLKGHPFDQSEQRDQLNQLAEAQSGIYAGQLAEFALGHIGQAGQYDLEGVSAFFDSLHQTARDASWQWLTIESPGWSDVQLWCRLIESPFSDVQTKLIEALKQRTSLPGTKESDLTLLWSTVLLGVHRGGRQKLKAIAQLGKYMTACESDAEQLMPVLIVAVRSIREPERRAGLAELVRLYESSPQLQSCIEQAVPELKVPTLEAAECK